MMVAYGETKVLKNSFCMYHPPARPAQENLVSKDDLPHRSPFSNELLILFQSGILFDQGHHLQLV